MNDPNMILTQFKENETNKASFFLISLIDPGIGSGLTSV